MEKEAVIKTKTEVTESLAELRTSIVRSTAEIGTEAPHFSYEAENLQTTLLQDVYEFEHTITLGKKTRQYDKLSTESLYEEISPSSESTSILQTLKVLNKYRLHLVNAISNYEDEITRENEMSLFFPLVFESDYLSNLSNNLQDVFAMIKVATFSKNKEPYSREQIMALTKIIDFIKGNIIMPDKIKDDIIDILDNQFDLSGPFAGVEILE